MTSRCDISPLGFVLTAAVVAATASACVVIAAHLNHSIFGVPEAEWMIAAGVASATAVGLLIAASVIAGRFCTCLRNSSPLAPSQDCLARCGYVRDMLSGFIGMQGVQCIACFVGSRVASIPVVGSPGYLIVAFFAWEVLQGIPVVLDVIKLNTCPGSEGSHSPS